ncbi:hypothetical protein [Spartinivicinus poritis]|uniref:hypothetical protein n=1 Tax=Spartinivicinus poritis TaxID=2994640 RepID=UPI003CC919A5
MMIIRKNNETPLFPIAGWRIGPIPSKGAVMFEPHYLAKPSDTPEQARKDRPYVLTPAQAQELGEKLMEVARKARTF